MTTQPDKSSDAQQDYLIDQLWGMVNELNAKLERLTAALEARITRLEDLDAEGFE